MITNNEQLREFVESVKDLEERAIPKHNLLMIGKLCQALTYALGEIERQSRMLDDIVETNCNNVRDLKAMEAELTPALEVIDELRGLENQIKAFQEIEYFISNKEIHSLTVKANNVKLSFHNNSFPNAKEPFEITTRYMGQVQALTAELDQLKSENERLRNPELLAKALFELDAGHLLEKNDIWENVKSYRIATAQAAINAIKEGV